MPDLLGAVFPGVLAMLAALSGRARSSLTLFQTLQALALATACTALLSRWHQDEEVTQLFLVSGAPAISLYLIWRGHQVTPWYGFVLCYVSTLPVDVFAAIRYTGTVLEALPGVGGAGLQDGLVVIPVLTAAGVWYGNWRVSHRSRTKKAAPS